MQACFGCVFCFNCTVPSDDQVTSLTGVDPARTKRRRRICYHALERGAGCARRITGGTRSVRKICRTYWRPLYAFVRQQAYSHELAEDLTQGFFALLLERRDFDTLRGEKGRLRSYLLVSLKHFLADEKDRAMAVNRGKGQRLIPLEDLRNTKFDFEPSDPSTAERIYERRWALTLLDTVFGQLADEYRKANKAALFDWLKQLLPDEPEHHTGRDRSQYGHDRECDQSGVLPISPPLSNLTTGKIAHTVAMPKDVEDELRHLISVLRA